MVVCLVSSRALPLNKKYATEFRSFRRENHFISYSNSYPCPTPPPNSMFWWKFREVLVKKLAYKFLDFFPIFCFVVGGWDVGKKNWPEFPLINEVYGGSNFTIFGWGGHFERSFQFKFSYIFAKHNVFFIFYSFKKSTLHISLTFHRTSHSWIARDFLFDDFPLDILYMILTSLARCVCLVESWYLNWVNGYHSIKKIIIWSKVLLKRRDITFYLLYY